MTRNQTLRFWEVPRFVDRLFDGGPPAKRRASVANATLGVIKTRFGFRPIRPARASP